MRLLKEPALPLDGPGFLFKYGQGYLFLLQNVQTGCMAHPAFYLMDTGVVYRGKVAEA
jgi:hypothetical protein